MHFVFYNVNSKLSSIFLLYLYSVYCIILFYINQFSDTTLKLKIKSLKVIFYVLVTYLAIMQCTQPQYKIYFNSNTQSCVLEYTTVVYIYIYIFFYSNTQLQYYLFSLLTYFFFFFVKNIFLDYNLKNYFNKVLEKL